MWPHFYLLMTTACVFNSERQRWIHHWRGIWAGWLDPISGWNDDLVYFLRIVTAQFGGRFKLGPSFPKCHVTLPWTVSNRIES